MQMLFVIGIHSIEIIFICLSQVLTVPELMPIERHHFRFSKLEMHSHHIKVPTVSWIIARIFSQSFVYRLFVYGSIAVCPSRKEVTKSFEYVLISLSQSNTSMV